MNTQLVLRPRSIARGSRAASDRRPADCQPGRFSLALFVALAVAVFAPPLPAQSAATGMVEGRVQNIATKQYLNNARVAVAGTSHVTFTDESGSFRLHNVPAGEVTLRVFFTGLDEQQQTVTVTAGQTLRQDFNLTSVVRYGEGSDVVELDEFVVQANKETNASTIAVNEQRFSANITSVVSTDEFGTMVDKNPGEFLKWLPGVDVEYFANNIVGVSVRGLGSVNTEVNFDGLPIASMNAEAVGRSFEVQYASAADIARVEIRKLPLPQDSSNALGGAINLVRRSAFEYSKRQISYQVLFQADGEKFTFDDIDGPKDKLRTRWRPNWEFKWTEPVSKQLGFAITLGQNNTIANTHWSLPGWNLGSTANNTAAENALAAGQALPTVPSIYNPGMRNPLNHNAPLMQGKTYGSLRVDWRPVPELTATYSLSATKGWKQVADDIRYRWDAAATGSGNSLRYNDDTTSLGRVGGGGIFHDNPLWRDISAPTISNVVDLKWKQGAWEAGASGVVSESKYSYQDMAHGFFNSTSVGNVTGITNIPHTGVGAGTANPISLTVNFHDTGYWAPGEIEALTTATGASSSNVANYTMPVEWWSNDVVRIGGARSRPGSSKEIVTAAKLFVERDFNLETPLSVRLGYDYTERYRNRRYDYLAWRFVGADGVPNSPDDTAALIAADNLPARADAAYGYPGAERISMSKLYDLYVANPTWFQFDEHRSFRLTATNNAAYELWETTHAPYLQLDWRLMQNRLRLTGGVRYEKTDAEAIGLLRDNSRAYQKYSDGTVRRSGDVLGTNGLPVTRAGSPVFLPGVTNNSYEQAVRTLIPKGARGEGGNDNTFPSLHVTYNITENLILQTGYARTQAKNRFDRSVVPDNNIVDDIQSSGALGRINLRNPDLEPWVGDNFEARISHYNATGGVLGVGVFRKFIDNYQVTMNTGPLSAEELAEWGFSPEYEGYEINTMFNEGTARIDGLEIEGRQSLDPFLPDWARGFLVRGSMAFTKLKGRPAGGDFNNLRDKRFTLNFGYRNRKFSANIGYIMNGRVTNNGLITSNGREGIQQTVPQHLVDFNVEYSISKYARVFFSGNNIFDELRAREDRYPERATAKEMGSSNTFGITFTAGITGQF